MFYLGDSEYGAALLEAEHWVLFVIIVKGHKKEEISRVDKSQLGHKNCTFWVVVPLLTGP